MHKHSLSKPREKYVVLFQLISTPAKTNTNYRVYSLTESFLFDFSGLGLVCVWHISDSPSSPFGVYSDPESWSSEWESRLSHGWPRWARLRLGLRQKVWMWAWSWASQQGCAVRWQMVTRAGKVTEITSSSIRGGCGGSPLRGGLPTGQSVSRQEQQASLHVNCF